MAAALRSNFDTQVELATQATIVLVLGIDELPRELERFIHDLDLDRRAHGAPGRDRGGHARHRHVRERGRRARRARRSSARRRSSRVDDSIGRVSAEAIAGYPPGIPVLLPGERITDDVIAYLRSLKAVGARLHGASDPDVPGTHPLRAWLRSVSAGVDHGVALAA